MRLLVAHRWWTIVCLSLSIHLALLASLWLWHRPSPEQARSEPIMAFWVPPVLAPAASLPKAPPKDVPPPVKPVAVRPAPPLPRPLRPTPPDAQSATAQPSASAAAASVLGGAAQGADALKPSSAPAPSSAPSAPPAPPASADKGNATPAWPPAPAQQAAKAALIPPRFDAGYADNPAPVYPAVSRREMEQGKVVLKVHVETNGFPSKVEVRTSSGYDRLDRAALNAVSRWKFVPAQQGSEPVSAWVLVPITFQLNS